MADLTSDRSSTPLFVCQLRFSTVLRVKAENISEDGATERARQFVSQPTGLSSQVWCLFSFPAARQRSRSWRFKSSRVEYFYSDGNT